jgi:acyl-CoA thioesterase-2
VGDLEIDTAVERVDEGQFIARLSRDWEIWRPMGGYVASLALRAAGETTPFDRPASFFCHYLTVASFDVVNNSVTTFRQARTAAAPRVEITQGQKKVLEATVWSVGDVDGLDHDATRAPDVPPPEQVPALVDLLSVEELAAGPPFAFWDNVEQKPLQFVRPWPPNEALEPTWQSWCRFRPTATFDDPWVDACRSVILVDVQSWPAASRPHAHTRPPYYGPSLDLYIAFHDPQPDAEWLLADGSSPIARDGLMGWTGRLWSPKGALLASGGGQLLCRRTSPAG